VAYQDGVIVGTKEVDGGKKKKWMVVSKGNGWWQKNYQGGGLPSIKMYDLLRQNIAVTTLHCSCSQSLIKIIFQQLK
jgi:hypothetical protein